MMIKEPDIFKVERDYPHLNNLEINNIPVWVIVRNHIKFELLALPGAKNADRSGIVVQSPNKKKISFVKKLYGWYLDKREAIRAYERIFNIKRRPQFLAISNRLEKKKFGTHMIDKLVTGLIDELGESKFIFLEDSTLSNPGDFKHKDIPLIETSDIGQALYDKADIPLEFTNGSLEELNEVLVKLGIVPVSISFFQGFFKRVDFMEKVFKKYKPKIFFSACYSYFADICAAKRCGIVTVELQHGIISENHPAYYSPLCLDKSCTADYIFTFGDKSFTSYDNCVYSANQVFAVGNHYLELLNEQKLNTQIKALRFSSYSVNICVPTDYISENELVEFLCRVAPQLPEVCFHLNPRERLQESTSELINPHTNISVVTDMPFQELVRYCDFNTSTDSTCCLEAINLGIPNLLYNIGNKAYSFFHNKVDPRFTRFILDAESYVLAVRSGMPAPHEEIRRSSNDTFKIGYRKNVLGAIAKIDAGQV